MSHYAVIVVTDENPETNPKALEAALQPFHEFECTGVDDEYVQEIDETENLRAEYNEKSERRYRDPDGAIFCPYEDRFYREWTSEELAKFGNSPPMGTGTGHGFLFTSKNWGDGRGHRSKVHFIPEGWEEVTFPVKELMSFAEFVEREEYPAASAKGHKYRYSVVNDAGEVVKAVRRTNPNAKWDWWVIGGRYSARFAAGYDPEKDPDNMKTCFLCHGSGMRNDALGQMARVKNPSYTCNGCRGTGKELKCTSEWKKIGNIARWGDLDMVALKASAVADCRAMVDEMVQKYAEDIGTHDAGSFEVGYAAYKAAVKVWADLPEPRPRGNDFTDWLTTQPNGLAAAAYRKADMWGAIEAREGQTIEEWIEEKPAVSAWAVVKDGQWLEKGKMGFFGMSFDDKAEWPEMLEAILATIRPDQFVTCVDCHI